MTVYENYEDCDDITKMTYSNNYRYYSKLKYGREHRGQN